MKVLLFCALIAVANLAFNGFMVWLTGDTAWGAWALVLLIFLFFVGLELKD